MIPSRSTTIHHPPGTTPPNGGVAPGGGHALAGMPAGAIPTSPYSAVIHHPIEPSAAQTGGAMPFTPPGASVQSGGSLTELQQLLRRAAELVAVQPPPMPQRRDVDQWLAALEARVTLLEAHARGKATLPAVEPPATEPTDE